MSPSRQQSRRVAIVTGGSSGIGRATVVALAERGYAVGFTWRSRERAAHELAAAVADRGGDVAHEPVDLAAAAAGAAAVERLAERLGGIDLLVNNAAVNTRGTLGEQTLAEWRHTFEVNLAAPFACTQAAVRLMRAAAAVHGGLPPYGVIVNVSSVIGRVPLPGAAAYCAAKAGLDMLTRVLAAELAPVGIRVVGIAPGQTATAMNYGDHPVDAGALTEPAIPLGRPADPREIAAAIAFLAAPEAAYATGTTLLVDGGLALVAGPALLGSGSSTDRPVDGHATAAR